MNALGALVILFAAMSVVSVLGLLVMHLVKSKKKQKIFCCILAVWGMLIAWMAADSTATNLIGQQLIAWAFGALGAVGLLVQLCGKGEKSPLTARILVTLSVILGMLNLFFF